MKKLSDIKSVCVYCGTSSQVNQVFKETAARFGEILANSGIRLIYGGGQAGLMGIVADAVYKNGGEVIGIIPGHIQDREISNHGVTELHVVDSMHTRKRMMAEKSDAFVVLPGGLGTLDEAFEILTWKYLDLHDKPIVFMNINNFYTPLIRMIDHMIDVGFTPLWQRNLFQVVDAPEKVLPELRRHPGHARLDTKRL